MNKKYKKKLLSIALAGVLMISSSIPVSAAWKEEKNGWWNKNTSEKGYSTGWDRIGGRWYYFDDDGWMKTGWIHVNGK